MKQILRLSGLYLSSILSLIIGGLGSIISFFAVFYQWFFNNSIVGIVWCSVLLFVAASLFCFGIALLHHLYKDSHRLSVDSQFESLYENKKKTSVFN